MRDILLPFVFVLSQPFQLLLTVSSLSVEPEAYTNYDYVPVVSEEWKVSVCVLAHAWMAWHWPSKLIDATLFDHLNLQLDDSNEVQGLVVRVRRQNFFGWWGSTVGVVVVDVWVWFSLQGDYVYVTTVSRVYKFPTHHCPHYTTCRYSPVMWRKRFARPCHLRAALSISPAPALVRKTLTATGIMLIQSVSRSTIPMITP